MILTPLILVTVSLLGVQVGSSVSMSLAEKAPIAGLLLTMGGMILALIRRNKILIGIAGIGLMISGGGLLFLLWVT